jgi:hypothetical protein
MRITYFWILMIFTMNGWADQVMRSPVEQANLVELYTSEGCSSCPPADRWLSSLKDHPALWKDLVPVAFHVDYWDYIGWKDRFSRPGYGKRQRRYAREGGVDVVYTPGVLSNGEEWRNLGWRSPKTDNGERVGVLEARVGSGRVNVQFTPVGEVTGSSLVVNVALLGDDLSTNVAAGENRGRELHHDFVVLKYEQSPLSHSSGTYQAEMSIPQSDIDARRFALALWVSPPDAQAPIQATGGWLEP